MSIASELQNYQTLLSNAYDVAEAKGGTLPQNKNLQNLATCIETIEGKTIIPPEAGTLTGISFQSLPNKLTYVEGETIDLTGCVVLGTYSQGYTYNVTGNCTFTINTPLLWTDTEVIVTLETFTLSIPIIVNGVPVEAPATTQALYHLNNDLLNEVNNTTATSNDTSPTYIFGKFGNGLKIDVSVSQEYYKFPLKSINWNDMITGSHTLEFWVKYTGSAGSYSSTSLYTNTKIQRSSGSNTDSLLYAGADGNIMTLTNSLCYSNANVIHANFPTTIPKDTWVHIALVFFNNHYYTFLNGTLMTTGEPKPQTNTLYENFNIYLNSVDYCYDEIMFCDEAKYLADFTPNHAPYYIAENNG